MVLMFRVFGRLLGPLGYLFLFLIFTTSELKSQTEMGGAREAAGPRFQFATASTLSLKPSRVRLNVFVKIANDELQFARREGGYEANYELSIVIYDGTGKQLASETRIQKITVTDYSRTNARDVFDLIRLSFNLDEGQVRLLVQITDLDTRRAHRQEKQLDLKDYGKGKVNVSDLIFVEEAEIENPRLEWIKPAVLEEVVDVKEQFGVYFELYTDPGVDSVFITTKILDEEGDLVVSDSYFLKTPPRVTPRIIRIPLDQLTLGRYEFLVLIQGEEAQVSRRGKFRVTWVGIPASLKDLDLAIRQLKYVAKDRELALMMKADHEEKQELFKKFWEKKDPTPATPRNELMEEYYRRIEYSNKKFGNFRNGWEMDMGKVYVTFGPPSDVERHPYEIDRKPYEIWYYYEINRRFVFVDETGFGEYRLITPFWRE